MARILLVEDNPYIMQINKEALAMYGYDTICATTLQEAEKQLRFHSPDLIVLDIMLPDGNGIGWCRKIKAVFPVPVIFLSALGENRDIIEGLRAGGDDYLSKPYDIEVLVARMEVKLRTATTTDRFFQFADLKMDTISAIAYLGGKDLLLTQKEFSVLLLLARSPEKMISKEEIYRCVWGTPMEAESNAFWTVISRLRKKVNTEGSSIAIVTQRQGGYSLERQ